MCILNILLLYRIDITFQGMYYCSHTRGQLTCGTQVAYFKCRQVSMRKSWQLLISLSQLIYSTVQVIIFVILVKLKSW